ncbi:MAG: hypothetical protein ACI8Y4_004214 [Candidatus Poriferisodalaceae bacterium]|jgi:hypothetical protein
MNVAFGVDEEKPRVHALDLCAHDEAGPERRGVLSSWRAVSDRVAQQPADKVRNLEHCGNLEDRWLTIFVCLGAFVNKTDDRLGCGEIPGGKNSDDSFAGRAPLEYLAEHRDVVDTTVGTSVRHEHQALVET